MDDELYLMHVGSTFVSNIDDNEDDDKDEEEDSAVADVNDD